MSNRSRGAAVAPNPGDATPVRRTQAQRSASTRSNLLDAAIGCLFEHGYAATTTIMVAERAGVSRGGMLHQFPTKADLMAFVIEADFEEEVALYHELLTGIDDPRDRLAAYPGAAWSVLSRPSGVAVLEILQGTRSDRALREKLAPVLARIEAHARDYLSQEFPGGLSVPMMQLIVGAVRGLSIGQVIAPAGEDVVDAVRLLEQLLRIAIDSGVLLKGARSQLPTARPIGRSVQRD